MQTENECLRCFQEQIRSTVRLCTPEPDLQARIVAETVKLLEDMDMTLSPPENAIAIYRRIGELSGVSDPFAELKEESNVFALTSDSRVRGFVNRVAWLEKSLSRGISLNLILVLGII